MGIGFFYDTNDAFESFLMTSVLLSFVSLDLFTVCIAALSLPAFVCTEFEFERSSPLWICFLCFILVTLSYLYLYYLSVDMSR